MEEGIENLDAYHKDAESDDEISIEINRNFKSNYHSLNWFLRVIQVLDKLREENWGYIYFIIKIRNFIQKNSKI